MLVIRYMFFEYWYFCLSLEEVKETRRVSQCCEGSKQERYASPYPSAIYFRRLRRETRQRRRRRSRPRREAIDPILSAVAYEYFSSPRALLLSASPLHPGRAFFSHRRFRGGDSLFNAYSNTSDSCGFMAAFAILADFSRRVSIPIADAAGMCRERVSFFSFIILCFSTLKVIAIAQRLVRQR